MEMQRIYGAKLPQKPGDCGSHGMGQSCDPSGNEVDPSPFNDGNL